MVVAVRRQHLFRMLEPLVRHRYDVLNRATLDELLRKPNVVLMGPRPSGSPSFPGPHLQRPPEAHVRLVRPFEDKRLLARRPALLRSRGLALPGHWDSNPCFRPVTFRQHFIGFRRWTAAQPPAGIKHAARGRGHRVLPRKRNALGARSKCFGLRYRRVRERVGCGSVVLSRARATTPHLPSP
jgi:hypothetical protein